MAKIDLTRKPVNKNLGHSILPTWDKKTFMLVAADRGYPSELSVIYAVAKKFNLAGSTVREMFSTGRISVERMLILGTMFEMTPREFCGCFLNNYFREDEQGHFVATLDNEELMLNPLPRTVHTKKEWESFFKDGENAE